MFTSLISWIISQYTPLGVYCEIYTLLGGNIESVKSQYSIVKNDIMYNIVLSFYALLWK